MTPFEKLTQARVATGEAIKVCALARRELEVIRSDRKASAEDVYELAQAARDAETKLSEAVKAECAAVLAAEDSE